MNLYDEIGKRLFVRTLNMGKALDLDDPRLLFSVRRAAVVTDTGVRFKKVTDERVLAKQEGGRHEQDHRDEWERRHCDR